jgi:hypothetical protein
LYMPKTPPYSSAFNCTPCLPASFTMNNFRYVLVF